MKTLRLFLASIGLLGIHRICRAQGASEIIAPVAGAIVGQVIAKDKSPNTQAAWASGMGVLFGYGNKLAAEKRAKSDFRFLQIGRYQETWIRAHTDWYHATMDRRSGLPPAFDGYWAMYSGLPTQEREFVQQRLQMPDQHVPTDKAAYLNYLSLQATNAQPAASGASNVIVVPTTTAIMPERRVNGVEYRQQLREFPRLP